MSHHVIEFDEACKSCGATGVYVGLGERDGSAVVCHTCRGTGKHHVKIEYDDFEHRARRDGVRRVVQVNPGVCIGEGNGHRLEDFGGIPYEEWFKGHPFPAGSENRKFTCPAWWYQSADYDRKPRWAECSGIGAFYDCKHFPDKAECWRRFDREAK